MNKQPWLIDGEALVERINSGALELLDNGAKVAAGIMVILRDEIESGRFNVKEEQGE